MVFISIPGDIGEPNTTFMREDWPRVLGIILIPTSKGTQMLIAFIGDHGQKQTEVPIPANRRCIFHQNTTGNNHIKSLWKWSWSLLVLPEDIPLFSVGAAIVFMFSFQSSEFWILSLCTARFFIWHCWDILPSLQAALNLLADLPAKSTRSGELSPVWSRDNWAQIFQTSAGCWSAATSLLCQWGCPGKAATATFSGAHRNQ